MLRISNGASYNVKVLNSSKQNSHRYHLLNNSASTLLNSEFQRYNKVSDIKVKSNGKLEAGRKATFQKALRMTLVIGQLFSLLPASGIGSLNASNVKFKKTSWKCVYSLLSLLGQMFMTIMCVVKMFSAVTTLSSTTPVIFYGTTCITMIMFFQVARKWPPLAQLIARTEEIDPNYDKTLDFKCNITCVVVLCLAMLEHILSLFSAFAGASVCYPKQPFYEGFVKHFYPWVFNFLPYSILLGMITQFLHFQSTFIWNFSDLFVICMSYYLTSRLEQINNKLRAAQGKYLPESFWRTARENYGRATQTVRKVDDVISGIIFISFANNLFFICLQLFNTLEDGIKGNSPCNTGVKGKTILGGYDAAVYFLFSLVYLISRSVAVSLIASQVNTASDVPAHILYDVPSPVYCIEVQRFLDQVNGDKIALSGLQFFIVTRGLLLTVRYGTYLEPKFEVAGTIVTYELVMFQFTSAQAPVNETTALLLDATTPLTIMNK